MLLPILYECVLYKNLVYRHADEKGDLYKQTRHEQNLKPKSSSRNMLQGNYVLVNSIIINFGSFIIDPCKMKCVRILGHCPVIILQDDY